MKSKLNEQMLPCWLEYRWISPSSIGWRMGVGESYRLKWLKWLKSLPLEEQQDYIKQFPEPKMWKWGGLWEESEEEPEEDFGYVNEFHSVTFWNKDGIPSYSYSDLLKDVGNGMSKRYLHFWGATPDKNGRITKSCLSQWWMEDFQVDTITYCCMEQYMMAEKARLFGDKKIEEKILHCNVPGKIKALGRKVEGFEEDVWQACRYSIVLNGNYYKFSQNKRLWNFLNKTKDTILVEASPYDRIWGIGLAEDKKEAVQPEHWKGINLLGFALMEVREELRRVLKGLESFDRQKRGENE